jgi:hypothetical protein
MVAPLPRRHQVSRPAWHAQFLALLPRIVTHARIAFRYLGPEAKAEKVQEVVCNALLAFVRLVQLGKADVAYACPLAQYGVAQVRDGRKVGGRLNVLDLSSEYCQRVKGFVMRRLDHFDRTEECWNEVLIEDKTCTPAELAASRIDVPAWFDTLRPRDRKIALQLAAGERTSDVAERFRLTAGRIAQLRRALHAAWQRFHGEPEPPQAAAVPA